MKKDGSKAVDTCHQEEGEEELLQAIRAVAAKLKDEDEDENVLQRSGCQSAEDNDLVSVYRLWE